MSEYAGTGSPHIVVDLFKGQDIKKNSGDPGGISLSEYLTSISLEKDLAQPAGMFELNLVYTIDGLTSNSPQWQGRPAKQSPSSLFDDLGPGQYIELSLANSASPLDPKYYMNGFIDNISFQESAGEGNSIQRTITINGRDYGALTQYFAIQYVSNAPDVQKLIFDDNLALQLDPKAIDNSIKYQSLNSFVAQVTNIILNQHHIASLRAMNSNIKFITPRCNVHSKYSVNNSDQDLQGFQGTLDQLFAKVQGPPWGELFIRDEKVDTGSAPFLYFRVAPFVNEQGYYENLPLYGNYKQQDIKYVTISGKDVMTSSLTKSQNDLYTFFLTTSSAIIGDSGSILSDVVTRGFNAGFGVGNPYWFGSSSAERQNRARKFGFRSLQVENPWLPVGTQQDFQNDPDTWTTVLSDLNLWLVNTMGHSEDLKSGTITARGINGARVGDYLYYERTQEYYYVQSISIEWQEGTPITTNYQVVRGTHLNLMDPLHRAGTPATSHVGGVAGYRRT